MVTWHLSLAERHFCTKQKQCNLCLSVCLSLYIYIYSVSVCLSLTLARTHARTHARTNTHTHIHTHTHNLSLSPLDTSHTLLSLFSLPFLSVVRVCTACGFVSCCVFDVLYSICMRVCIRLQSSPVSHKFPVKRPAQTHL